MARLSPVGRIVDASELICRAGPAGRIPTIFALWRRHANRWVILLRTDSARIVSSKDAGALDDLAKAGAGNKAVDMTPQRS